MKKIDQAAAFLAAQPGLFRCPVCLTPYEAVVGHSCGVPTVMAWIYPKKGRYTLCNEQWPVNMTMRC